MSRFEKVLDILISITIWAAGLILAVIIIFAIVHQAYVWIG